jgi:hypothetical protein
MTNVHSISIPQRSDTDNSKQDKIPIWKNYGTQGRVRLTSHKIANRSRIESSFDSAGIDPTRQA